MKKQESKFPFEMYSASGEGVLVSARYSSFGMELIEITAGEAIVQIGTELTEAVAGDFLFVPKGLVFSVTANEGGAAVRGISFDNSIIESNMTNYENELLYMFYVQSENKMKVFGRQHPIHSVIRRCMSDSYDEYMAKDVCYKLPIRANIYIAMTALLRYYSRTENEYDRAVYHNVLRLRPVINYIAERYADKIYIENLAEIIMVSADYFTKMFKDSMGKTPVDYINGIRINRAMQLLVDSEKSVAEISDEIGFCNANYFNKIFKQYIGITPLAYRKNNKD